MPPPDYPPPQLTPQQFELEVKKTLDSLSAGLTDYRSAHCEILSGPDGEYEIDITVRFSALGVEYLTLIECKYYRKPVEREKVQALHAKMQSLGAHKAILFSTSGFQSGANDYAEAHGIALVHVVDGRNSYIRRSADGGDSIPWSQVPASIPKIVGWRVQGNRRCIISPSHPEYLREYLQE